MNLIFCKVLLIEDSQSKVQLELKMRNPFIQLNVSKGPNVKFAASKSNPPSEVSVGKFGCVDFLHKTANNTEGDEKYKCAVLGGGYIMATKHRGL